MGEGGFEGMLFAPAEKAKQDLKEGDEGVDGGLYSVEQARFLHDKYGIDPVDGEVLVTRGKTNSRAPKGLRSCCILSPFGQDSFYVSTGFVCGLRPEDIPWINMNDAGTSVNAEVSKPEGSIDINDYFAGAGDNFQADKYTETVVDLNSGMVRAVYDLREVPPKPDLVMRITNPKLYNMTIIEIRDILSTREEWRRVANDLGVPFITDLPDQSIVAKLREKDRQVSAEFSAYSARSMSDIEPFT